MGAVKNFYLSLIEAGDTPEEQDAIEWCLHSNYTELTGKLKAHINHDRQVIREEMPHILEAFRRVARENDAADWELAQELVA